jgi:CheY-like chemotaxis protein
VLVIDDSPTVLSLLQAALEAHHLEVQTASDGAEGLEKIREFSPHLIVTDSIMPRLDGFALLARVKQDPATRRIPVIMLTSDPDDPRPGGVVQPDAVIAKSAEIQPLLAEIRRLLRSAGIASF